MWNSSGYFFLTDECLILEENSSLALFFLFSNTCKTQAQNKHAYKLQKNLAGCQSPSALRRPPQSHLLAIIPWVQSSRPSAVWEKDHSDSDSAESPHSGSQSIRSPPCKPTPGEAELKTSPRFPTKTWLNPSDTFSEYGISLFPYHPQNSQSLWLLETDSAPVFLPVATSLVLLFLGPDLLVAVYYLQGLGQRGVVCHLMALLFITRHITSKLSQTHTHTHVMGLLQCLFSTR